jgi:uncharacterized protein (TIGR01777 family)
MLLASRKEPVDDKYIQWDVETGFTEPDKLEGIDAVVHLAGENIAGLRWTDEKKKAIRDSRVLGTRSVVDAISRLEQKPNVFIASSAIGFYGERGDEEVTESSASGKNFLADVSREWEAESRRAEDAGIRTVLLRTGIVLSKDGGALGTMLLPFKLGVGGVVRLPPDDQQGDEAGDRDGGQDVTQHPFTLRRGYRAHGGAHGGAHETNLIPEISHVSPRLLSETSNR